MKTILFNTEMTKAILDGRKVQFRLHINNSEAIPDNLREMEKIVLTDMVSKYIHGDTIQVVEQYEMCMSDSSEDELFQKDTNIFLKVTNVRVERLQDITLDDICDEGFDLENMLTDDGVVKEVPHDWWINLWNKTAPKGYDWDSNHYVFVYEFEIAEK